MSAAVDHIIKHILNIFDSKKSPSPLFVALQGPQGSGKSYLTGLTQQVLSSPPHSLRVVTVSIDDFYLTHDGLVKLAADYPENPLWRGRGQPGSHDIPLALDVFKVLLQSDGSQVEIPRFEKSLFNGEGDRLPPTGDVITTPVDIVILEGWCVGFYPISLSELEKRWNGDWQKQKTALGISDEMVGSKNSLEDVNRALRGYLELWSYFDVFVQIHPTAQVSPYSIIYQWRLEQEHYMKALNGGLGMTDDAVKLFVDRYIPGYVFFGDGVTDGYQEGDISHAPPWAGKGLRICIDEQRDVVSVNRM